MERTSRSFVAFITGSAFTMLLAGCTFGLTENQLVGSWESRRGVRVSCIDIRADYTYSQKISANGVEELSTEATWELEPHYSDSLAVTFNSFHHIADDGSGIRYPAGYWLVVPEHKVPFGEPELVVSDDVHIVYTKRESPCE